MEPCGHQPSNALGGQKAEEILPCSLQGEHGPADTWVSDVGSGTVRKYILGVGSHRLVAIFFFQPQETDTPPFKMGIRAPTTKDMVRTRSKVQNSSNST